MQPAFEVRRALAPGPFVIVCDHATNYIPPEFNNLGLPVEDRTRHIAWDIGAAAIAERLSLRFDSPLVLSGVSRLVIDCNRQLDAAGLIPEISDGTPIVANTVLSQEVRQLRIDSFFVPYHEAVESVLIDRPYPTIFLSIHSMTDRMNGIFRPWPISFSSFEDRSLVDSLIAALDGPVGDNEPYDLDPRVDYSTPYHAIRRGLPHLQIEFRQDLVASEEGQALWAGKLTDAMEKAALIQRGLRPVK